MLVLHILPHLHPPLLRPSMTTRRTLSCTPPISYVRHAALLGHEVAAWDWPALTIHLLCYTAMSGHVVAAWHWPALTIHLLCDTALGGHVVAAWDWPALTIHLLCHTALLRHVAVAVDWPAIYAYYICMAGDETARVSGVGHFTV